ncbi:MAG: hypothetical protein MSC30_07380 [Gaiellaceae bacterium MAG52_C11]|nr:hypothetical protein [Candidatus Gaiellasilicea maunaloa]
MAMRVERTLPASANGVLEFSSGSCHFKEEQCDFKGEQPVRPVNRSFDAVFRLGRATPATVPSRQV